MKRAAIGIDIGGTNVRIGLVDEKGRILARLSFPTRSAPGRKRLLDALVTRVVGMAAEARRNGIRVLGVGVGAPGAVDAQRGFVYFFPNLPGWGNTPLRRLLERRLGMRVRVDNDANLAALGEFRFGAGRGCWNLIALTLGTGIGGGIVIGGRLFHGHRFSAAEIGHLVINEEGPRCSCGNRGCVETYVGSGYFVREIRRRLRAGRRSILRRWVERDRRKLTPLLAAEAARKGDPLARRLWAETAGHLGTALAGLLNVLNPERIILGGGIAQNRRFLFGPLVRVLRKKAFPTASRSVRVMPAALGIDAGLVGAAALFFEPKKKR